MHINDLGEPITEDDLKLGKKVIMVRHVREPDGLPTTPIKTHVFYGFYNGHVQLISSHGDVLIWQGKGNLYRWPFPEIEVDHPYIRKG